MLVFQMYMAANAYMLRCSINAIGGFPEAHEVSSTMIQSYTLADHKLDELRFQENIEQPENASLWPSDPCMGSGKAACCADKVAMGVTPPLTALLSMHGKFIRLLHGL